MSSPPAIDVAGVFHHYGNRVAVRDLSLRVETGEIFSILGPNGSGKTTLFRVLSTLIPLQQGEVSLLGFDLRSQAKAIRRQLGVVFQSPSLDKKLTVAENVRHHGHLYGLSGHSLRRRCDEMLSRLALTDRAGDRVETLSGGLRRRVELAKGMLSQPKLLLLDEPSTGLDPGARIDLWQYLSQIQDTGVTILMTTHLLDEAERADRLAILDEGQLVALDTPEALRATVGGDSITIRCAEPAELAQRIESRFACQTLTLDDGVRLEQPDGPQWIPRLSEAFSEAIQSISVSKPTLEDVFIDRTGHRFWDDASEAESSKEPTR